MYFFFFQAEDGIRDVAVTGVQTCALPIFRHEHRGTAEDDLGRASLERRLADLVLLAQQVAAVQIYPVRDAAALEHPAGRIRSEEHTSELQSRLHLVCRLLLEKKKTATGTPITKKSTPRIACYALNR